MARSNRLSRRRRPCVRRLLPENAREHRAQRDRDWVAAGSVTEPPRRWPSAISGPDGLPPVRSDRLKLSEPALAGLERPGSATLVGQMLQRGIMDFGWRSRIRNMLEKDPTVSFDEIAEVLNRKKHVHRPPGAKQWTAAIVRKAYVS